MKGFEKCVAVRIYPQFWCCGESISKNAFRWFESVYRPEMMREQSSTRKCIYKNPKNFRVEKSGEISRNLRFSRFFVPASKSDTHHVYGLQKRYFPRFAIRIRTLVKYNAFRLKGEKLHQHFFTIHYYLLPNRQVSKVKSEK